MNKHIIWALLWLSGLFMGSAIQKMRKEPPAYLEIVRKSDASVSVVVYSGSVQYRRDDEPLDLTCKKCGEKFTP